MISHILSRQRIMSGSKGAVMVQMVEGCCGVREGIERL